MSINERFFKFLLWLKYLSVIHSVFGDISHELSAIGEYDKALALLQFVDDNILHLGHLYVYFGDVYRAIGEKELAKEAYLKCLKTYPEYPQLMD